MNQLLYVGLGGGLGAMLRYAVGLLPWRGAFPLATLAVNLLGAVAIGFLAGVVTQRQVDQRAVLFWKTGVCGGFTTFSTFSLEAVQLLEGGHYAPAGLYLLGSVGGCLLGVWLGMGLSRWLAG